MNILQRPMLLGDNDFDKIVICLPGRGGNGFNLANDYQNYANVADAAYLAVTPKGYAWYPPPKGPGNSETAVKGLPIAVEAIKELIDDTTQEYGIHREKIVLAGFSAGAVVAIRTAMLSEPLGGCIAHSGAILNVDDVPNCNKPSMPFLLTHSKDDSIFSYKERFLPMCASMQEKHWLFETNEQRQGGHSITVVDFKAARKFLEKI